MKKTVVHPVIGEVTVSRTRGATRISLSIRPDGSVRLSHPMFVSQRRALKFLDEKCDWIAANRLGMESRYGAEPFDETYRTRRHTLHFVPAKVEKTTAKVREGRIVVKHPAALDAASKEVQAAAEKGITEALRLEAKETLPDMVAGLAAQHGFACGSVCVKATRSKWGSCTARNDINLSLFVALLPEHLAEYIVLHELCHTVHKDHSERFHGLLDRVTGGRSKELNRELRSYRPDVRCANRAPKGASSPTGARKSP